MLISFPHRFLFIHIPKVAGMSVKAALEPVIHSPTRIVFNKVMKKCADGLGWKRRFPLLSIYPPHLTAMQWRDAVSQPTFDKMFKFAFVRNPWDREVSLYHYILQKPHHMHHDQVKATGSFEKYIAWRVAGNVELQTNYLINEAGAVIVDFVGRYEHLAEDMDHVVRTLNFSNVTLPHINSSAHKDYRSYYSNKTRELVEEHFKEDIVRFDYSFDHEFRLTTSHREAVQMQYSW